MKKRWELMAIVILVIATVIGLTALQTNIDQHKEIDRRACLLALKNREIVNQTLEVLIKDPGARTSETQSEFIQLHRELGVLIAQAHGCRET